MDRINDTLFAHWNTDSNGNPVSVACNETQVVSPIHLCVQLNQIPDDLQQFTVTIGNTRLSEVFDSETIGANNYRVDYGDGIVWFHSSRAGQTVSFSYYGRGWKAISANRVLLNDGQLVEENTLGYLVKLNQQAITTINNIQASFDETLAEVRNQAEIAKSQILAQKNSTNSQIQNYVNQIKDFASTCTYNIERLIEDVTTQLNEDKEVALQLKRQIQDYANKSIEYIRNERIRATEEIDTIVAEVEQYARQLKQNAQGQVDTIVNTLDREMTNRKNQFNLNADKKQLEIDVHANNFNTYLENKKASIDEEVEEALREFNILVKEMEGKKLQFNSEFADAQLERLNQFAETQEAREATFNETQVTKQQQFNKSQTDRETEFTETMADYENVFNEMVNKVYDENAIANLQNQINDGFDEVTCEDYLELIREGDKIVGSVGGQKITFYSNYDNEVGNPVREKMKEMIISGKQSVHVGANEPVDVDQLWVDTKDDNLELMEFPQEHALQEFQGTVQKVLDKVNKIENSTRMDDLFAGRFQSAESTSDNTDDGTVKHIRIKVGTQPNLRQLREGELAYCTDTGNLYIGARLNPMQTIVSNVLIGGNSSNSGDTSGGNNSSSVTAQYVELLDDKQVKYRIMMGEDGNMKIRNSAQYTAEPPKPSDAPNYKGLIINRYYGGNTRNNGQSPVSHGFIELYNNNPSRVTMNLNGLSIYYKTIADPVWRQLRLKGYLPFQHSYLIRCAQHNSPENITCRLHIDKFDQDWSEQVLSSESCMIYLAVGTDALSIVNPFRIPTTGKKMEGYIDMMSCSSEGITTTLSAFEDENSTTTKFKGYYRRYLNGDTGIQRIDFQDTDIAYEDYEPVNYRTCDVSIYKPRHFDDGAWGLYYNKLKLNEAIPNMVNMQYGKQWHTRTFTWETKVVDEGYLRYRKTNATRWTTVESNREIVYHPDQDCTIHRLVVKNLEAGVYEYQVGSDGMWSDLSTFEVKHYTGAQDEHLKFLLVSDQQGWYESEYQAWRWASKFIEANEDPNDWDFAINAGDISQNGLRPFEWRYYYKYTNIAKDKCHMLVCGNNDLAENKTYSYGFKYYDTQEEEADVGAKIQGNKPYASCHSHDLGFVHFVVMNSNVVEDSDLMVKQFCWIKQDVEAAKARPNPPRWFVLVAHHGALTVCRMKTPQQMIPFVEDIGFDVVICGHHHTYSRSKPIKMNIRSQVEAKIGGDLYRNQEGDGSRITNAVYSIGYLEAFRDKQGNPAPPAGCTADQTTQEGANGNIASAANYVNNREGTYWIMCQATGFKLKSNKDLEKDPIPWWYGWQGSHPYMPTYMMWDFGYNEIRIVAKGIEGIMKQDAISKEMVNNPDCSMSTMRETIIDELTIKHKSLR